jgi:WD40 repeat protein
MIRWFIILLLAVSIAGGVAYYSGWLEPYIAGGTEHPYSSDASKPKPNLGDPLYLAVKLDPLPRGEARATEQFVIEPCHVVARYKQDVTFPRGEGQVLFIGQQVTDMAGLSEEQRTRVQVGKIFDGMETRSYKYLPWEEGDIVEPGQGVAVINPTIADQEVASKKIKVVAADADYRATRKILEETQTRKGIIDRLRAQGKGLVSDLDVGDASVGVAKYSGEEATKKIAIEVAERELYQAQLIQSQHFLESGLTGAARIKKIYKQQREGVKMQDVLMELQDISSLRVEGSVDSQYYLRLLRNKDAICYLEPSEEMGPQLELMKAHTAAVTSVAFCADGMHFVSGSDDTTVCVWNRGQREPIRYLRHKSPVRSVACSPTGMWVVAGCADGTLWRWDLTRQSEPFGFKEPSHRGPVTALAFSPDGAHVASGGEDNTILLWKTATGEQVYAFDSDHGAHEPHHGTITSLSFTPQCKLISASRDNTLRVWSLFQKGVEMEGEPIRNRGGTVGHLGVSADGRFMLFDKGKTIQLRNTEDGAPICVLDNLGGASPFDTLALFSPDGLLMLTGGAGEGRLHLWKTPTHHDRAFQVKELVTKDRTPITSAAFAPKSKDPANTRLFAVTGSKDGYVHLWLMPNSNEVEKHLIVKDGKGKSLHIDLLEQQQDAGKTRIAINLVNPDNRLIPGERVTAVVLLPLDGQ